MSLTTHQNSRLVNSLEILRSNDRLLVKGSAGVGKTYFANYLIEQLVKLGIIRKDTIASAPTNKALTVLRGKVSDSVIFSTTHSALKLKRKIDYKTGNISFKPNFPPDFPPLKGAGLIIIDEASMLSKELLSYIEKYAKKFNVKVVFIGDEKQLPPVNEDVSPVFVAGYPEIELTEIIRQGEGNPIIDLSRDYTLMHSKPEWLVGNKGYTFTQDLQRIINRLADVNGTDDMKYLAWTNKKVDSINEKVRERIYTTPRKVEKGESLVFNNPYLNSFYTNQEILVEKLEVVDINTVFGAVGRLNLKVYCVNPGSVENLDGPKGLPKGVLIIHEDSQDDFNSIVMNLKAMCKAYSFSWKTYYAFLENFADTKYNHALTIHKSQGSTYKKTIVDVRDINKNRNTEERKKLLYTGFTRASDLLILNNI